MFDARGLDACAVRFDAGFDLATEAIRILVVVEAKRKIFERCTETWVLNNGSMGDSRVAHSIVNDPLDWDQNPQFGRHLLHFFPAQ